MDEVGEGIPFVLPRRGVLHDGSFAKPLIEVPPQCFHLSPALHVLVCAHWSVLHALHIHLLATTVACEPRTRRFHVRLIQPARVADSGRLLSLIPSFGSQNIGHNLHPPALAIHHLIYPAAHLHVGSTRVS